MQIRKICWLWTLRNVFPEGKHNSTPILDSPMTLHQFPASEAIKNRRNYLTFLFFFGGNFSQFMAAKSFIVFHSPEPRQVPRDENEAIFLSAKSIKYFLLFHNSLALKGILPTSLEFNCSKTTINFNFSICFWLCGSLFSRHSSFRACPFPMNCSIQRIDLKFVAGNKQRR